MIRPKMVPSSLPVGEAEALAGVEVSAIPRGFVASDAIVKKAKARLLLGTPVTPGKFLILIDGEVADVEEALQAGKEASGEAVIDFFMLPYAHPQLEPAVFGICPPRPQEPSLGLIETSTSCSGLLSADAALKAAPVSLAVMHLSVGIGGKCYYVLWGDLCDVEAAVEAAESVLEGTSRLLSKEIIPRPHEDFLRGLGL